jgi:hypothetical protein
MIIHEMRNPTNQISFTIEQALETLQKAISRSKELEESYIQLEMKLQK